MKSCSLSYSNKQSEISGLSQPVDKFSAFCTHFNFVYYLGIVNFMEIVVV